MVRIAVIAATAWAAGAGLLSAQLTSPSAHFGASAIPLANSDTYVALTLDRFTPTGKVTRPGVYNAIDQTIAFNFLSYSVASESERWQGLIYRATLQLGWGHDQPSAWIQNALHFLASLAPVNSTNPRNNTLDAVANVEAVHWGPMGERLDRFVGGGATVGTPYSEAWMQVGAVTDVGGAWPEIGATLRVGAPFRGGAFPDSTLTPAYAAVEAMVEMPVDVWVDREWLPLFFIAIRQDTGFFADEAGNGLPELNGSFGFSARDGSWRFEAWNEYFGGRFKDIGPTGGGRISFRVPAG